MGDVTPIAASLGISTAELFSSLAATTSQGLQTNKSITALKAAMSNIIKPSKEAADAAEALGIDFSVSALKSKGWIGFLKDVKKGLEQASPQFAELSDKIATNSTKMLELEKAGKKNTTEYKTLKTVTKDFIKEQELLVQANDSSIGGFATLFGSVEGLNSMLMLTSDQGMALYDESMKQMGEDTGALQQAFDKMDATEAQQFKKAMNEFKLAAIDLGREFLPLATDIAGVLKDWIKTFRELPSWQKEFIAKGALMLACLGPVLTIGGKILDIFKTLSKLKFDNLNFDFMKGFGKKAGKKAGAEFAADFTTEVAGMKLIGDGTAKAAGKTAAVSAASEFGPAFLSAVPFIAIPVGVVAAGWAIGDTVHEMATRPAIDDVDLFAPKTTGNANTGTTEDKQQGKQYVPDTQTISAATKEVVSAYMEMDDALTKNLDLIRFKAPSVTADTFKQITSQFNELNETIKTKINENFETEKGYMSALLVNSSELTDAQKQEILMTMEETKKGKLDKLSEYGEKEKEYNRMLQSDDIEIQRAGLEGMLGLQGEYSTLFLENSGATAGEQAVIESRLNEYKKNATAETAIEILNIAADERDKAITAADEKYKGQINALEKSGLKEKNGALYDELKRQAEDEHTTAVNEAKGKYDGTCTAIKEGSQDVAKEIDFANRTIKSPLDKWKESMGSSLDYLIGKFNELIGKIQYCISHPAQSFFDYMTGDNYDGTGVASNYQRNYNAPYATGTLYASRGVHLVGENGPEMVTFKGGERVYNASQTQEILSGSKASGYQDNSALINEFRSLKETVANMKNDMNVTFNSPKAIDEYEAYRQMEKLAIDMKLGYL